MNFIEKMQDADEFIRVAGYGHHNVYFDRETVMRLMVEYAAQKEEAVTASESELTNPE